MSEKQEGSCCTHCSPLGLHLQVGSGPSAAHQAWILCRNTGPPSPAPWPCQAGEKCPGRSLAPHGLGTDRRRDRKLPWGPAWPGLLPGTSSTCPLRESLVGYPRAPKSRGKQRQIETPKGSGPILWPNLVAGWGTPRRGSQKEGREKAQLGPDFSGSAISLWQHALRAGHRREN